MSTPIFWSGHRDQGWSVDENAERIMGKRDTNVVFIDYPCELGYRCPACRRDAGPDAPEWDEILEWSEYIGFIWCPTCNRDYPSAFCVPVERETPRPQNHAGWDAAIGVFLDTVEGVVLAAERRVMQRAQWDGGAA